MGDDRDRDWTVAGVDGVVADREDGVTGRRAVPAELGFLAGRLTRHSRAGLMNVVAARLAGAVAEDGVRVCGMRKQAQGVVASEIPRFARNAAPLGMTQSLE